MCFSRDCQPFFEWEKEIVWAAMDAGDHRSFLDLAELETREVVPVKATKALRLLHGAVPLERKFCVLLRRYRNHTGLLSVPWGDFQLHFPSSWLNDVCDAV